MRGAALVRRSLLHYWRTHAAVALGVATAVAVLSGSLLVGESVRHSLRRIALERLGRTAQAITSARALDAGLATRLTAAGAVGPVAPLLALRGSVSRDDGAGRAGGGGRDAGGGRGVARGPGGPPPWLSPALWEELRAEEGQSLLVLAEAASDVPGSTLFGRRDEPGRRLRVTARGALPRERMGEFVLQPTAREVRAVFVPLPALQRALEREGRINTLLLAGAAEATPASAAADLEVRLARAVTLDDLGLRLRSLPRHGALSFESVSGLIDDHTAMYASAAAQRHGYAARAALVYLATALRAGERSVPYSLVAALEQPPLQSDTILLNEWAAADLGARTGTRVTLEYLIWEEDGRITTRSADFSVAGITPMAEEPADRDLVPDYPGITESLDLADWDPPFPVELSRIRARDEEYWDRYRTTPKAVVAIPAGQALWGHRLGRLSSLRFTPPAGTALEDARVAMEREIVGDLLAGGDPAARLRALGLDLLPVRERALQAARGSTDFGEYFLYFSAFLVASALLLAGLFFRLGLEQRLREVGLLRAVGFSPRRLLAQFLAEGLAVAVAGAALGTLGAVGYARLVVWGLRTVWVGAVGTRDLEVAVSAPSLVAGAVGGTLAAVLAIGWTLRGLRRRSPRALMAGALDDWAPPAAGRRRLPALAPPLLALALLAAAGAGALPPAAAFFGAGALLLATALVICSRLLRGRPAGAAAVASVARLGLRGASFRPGRSLLCIGLVAAAVFIIVSVGAFRHDDPGALRDPRAPSGGFTLLAQSDRPLHNDPRTATGRAALGLPDDALGSVALARFRRAAGEDASCLNLYRPSRPTVLGAEASFLRENRFAFASSLASTPEQRANPWLLLEGEAASGAIPVAADATTLRYVLHQKLGDEMALGDSGVRVRFVAALAPGLLQGELVTAERHFQDAFPREDGYRFFLLQPAPGGEAALSALLESRLADFGFDVSEAAARLRAYHQVENTYIATFQTLGALGLLLGTVGLAAVLLRNAFEQRRELALLRAVGYRGAHLRRLVLSQNALLLGLGLLCGLLPAMVAVLPALRERGGSLPLPGLAALLAALIVVAAATTAAAVAVIRRLPLLASLRSE
jgi:hypothetical protein